MEKQNKYPELTPEMIAECAQYIQDWEKEGVPAEEITERVIGTIVNGILQDLGYAFENSETVSTNPLAYRCYLSNGFQFLLTKYPDKRVLTVFVPEGKPKQQTEFVQGLSATLKEKIPAEVFIVCGKKVLGENLPSAPSPRSAAVELELPWYNRMTPGTIVFSPGHDGGRAIFLGTTSRPDFVYQFISLGTGEPLEIKGDEFEEHCKQGAIVYEGSCERVEDWATEEVLRHRRRVADEARALAANRASSHPRSK